jgi:hypothetical protein
MFSFSASPWGCHCCRASAALSVPHGGSATEATLARFPCIHAGSENPVDGYNAASEWLKSIEKPRFPQFSLVFVLF